MKQFLITVLVLLIVGTGGYYAKYGSPFARTPIALLVPEGIDRVRLRFGEAATEAKGTTRDALWRRGRNGCPSVIRVADCTRASVAVKPLC